MLSWQTRLKKYHKKYSQHGGANEVTGVKKKSPYEMLQINGIKIKTLSGKGVKLLKQLVKFHDS
jgi:hypothetical protein